MLRNVAGALEPVSLVRPVTRIYLFCDQKLTMGILYSCCQSDVSCVLFINIPFCVDTVRPLAILSGANWEC